MITYPTNQVFFKKKKYSPKVENPKFVLIQSIAGSKRDAIIKSGHNLLYRLKEQEAYIKVKIEMQYSYFFVANLKKAEGSEIFYPLSS